MKFETDSKKFLENVLLILKEIWYVPILTFFGSQLVKKVLFYLILINKWMLFQQNPYNEFKAMEFESNQGILKGDCTIDLLFDWFGISCMTTDNFCFYFQNRLIQISQTGGQWYSDTSPFSIPWSNNVVKSVQIQFWGLPSPFYLVTSSG